MSDFIDFLIDFFRHVEMGEAGDVHTRTTTLFYDVCFNDFSALQYDSDLMSYHDTPDISHVIDWFVHIQESSLAPRGE